MVSNGTTMTTVESSRHVWTFSEVLWIGSCRNVVKLGRRLLWRIDHSYGVRR